MRLRWKFFFILLAFSLVPMVVLTGINRKHVERLGRAILIPGASMKRLRGVPALLACARRWRLHRIMTR